MDHQCLFRQDQENYLQHHRGAREKFSPEPCPYIEFKHLSDAKVEITRRDLTESDAIGVIQNACSSTSSQINGQLLILSSPARQPIVDADGRYLQNAEAPIPFTQVTFNCIVEIMGFHRGFFSKHRHCQVTRLDSGQIRSFYIENFSHRNHWLKAFVAFNPQTHITNVMLHNLMSAELEFIHGRLDDALLRPLTIHPMFVLVLIMELLFNEAQAEARIVFGDSIRLQHKANLHGNEAFKHLVEENLDIEDAATKAFGNEQSILTLLEKMEFSIKMGNKVMSWMKDIDLTDTTEEEKTRFNTAGQIISNRFAYLVDGLDLQLIRVQRAQNHSQLNRTGLETRSTAVGNKFNARISEQSRDIAKESKRDSSAMKAIAVLTMFFLPGTFIAALFAMPLFDWGATNSSVIVNQRFWIYWAVTIPTTILILVVWRVWYVFQEWRNRIQGKSSTADFVVWLRSGRFEVDEEIAGSGRTKSFAV